MRKSCVQCSLKHLSQAYVLLKEWRKGYPEHFDYAMGHISEAEDELVDQHPVLAAAVRQHRKMLEADPKYRFPFKSLLSLIREQTGYSLSSFLTFGGSMKSFLKSLLKYACVVAAASSFAADI